MIATGNRPSKRRDRTMRYIARNDLWNAVALQCQVSAHAVKCWKRVPDQHVESVYRATGRSLQLIRPDLYA